MSYLEQLKNKVESETTTDTSVTEDVQSENVSSDNVQTTQEVAEEVTQDSPSGELSETQTEQKIEQDNVVSTQENQPPVTETQQTVFANEELAKINEFVKRTGKGVEDYYALQKTSEQLDQRELLKKYYSEKEVMTEKEVNRELKKFEDVNDEDLVDEDTKELYEIQLEKASKWYDESRESLLDSLNAEQLSETQLERYSIEEYQNLYVEQVQKVQQYNNQVIASAIPELEYELEYGGSKENGIEPLKFTYKPDEAFLKEATKVGLDMGVLINDFFENGQVKDPKGLLKVLTQSYAPTNKVMIDKLIEQAVLNDRISRSKSVRNVHNNLYQSVETVADDSNKAAYEAYRKSKNKTPYE